MDTSIRFNVEGENEVQSAYDRLSKSAEELARDMIRSSRQYSTSGKEVVQDIEAQISAIERAKRADQDRQRLDIGERVSSGELTPQQGRQQLTSLRVSSQAEDTQLRLLKDIVDAIKDTSRQELRQDRIGVEESIKNDERLTRLGISDDEDEFEALKRIIQRQQLGDVKESERGETNRFGGIFGGVESGANIGASFITRNPMVAMAGLLTMIPLIGQALSGIAQQAFSAAEGYQNAMGSNVGISGGSQERFRHFNKGFGEDMGYTMTESLRTREAMTRASGRDVGSSDVRDLQLLMRGAGVDQATLMGMEGLQRGETSGRGIRQNTQALISALRGSGALEGDNMALLPEYMQILVELGKRQVQITGEVNTGVNVKTIAALSNIDDTFKNPNILSGLVSSLQTGLSQAPNQIAGGLQYAALSKISPQGSLWELDKMKEDPLKNIDYLKSYMQILQQSSAGNQEMFFRNIHLSGLAPSKIMAEKLGKGYMGGGLEDVLKEGGGLDLVGRADAATGELSRMNAVVQNRLADTGDTLVRELKELISKISGWESEYGTIHKQTITSLDELKTSVDKSNIVVKTVINGLANVAQSKAYPGMRF